MGNQSACSGCFWPQLGMYSVHVGELHQHLLHAPTLKPFLYPVQGCPVFDVIPHTLGVSAEKHPLHLVTTFSFFVQSQILFDSLKEEVEDFVALVGSFLAKTHRAYRWIARFLTT